MALAMARPWKHPKTGIYWLRKRVPDELRAAVGKAEEKFSLKTRDPAEAKRLHAAALVALEERWTRLREPERKLDIAEFANISEEAFQRCVAQDCIPGINWDIEVGERLWDDDPNIPMGEDPIAFFCQPKEIQRLMQEKWCREVAQEYIAYKGLRADDTDQLRIAKAIGFGTQQAALLMRRRAKGDFGAAPTPSMKVAAPNPTTAKASIPFKSVLDGWAAEKRPSAKTLYSWSRVIDQLIAFVGHNDVSSLTRENLLGWKQALISSGLRTKTIRDSKLAPLRAILQWGVDNGKLTENPASRVVVDVRAKVIERIRGFTDEEASLILKAAHHETDPVKKWIPLLCAYSGARISEVCQLRAKDILQIQDVWCMKFDPEAGSLKNENSERVVPLHPAIKDAGFLKFVNAASSGPLFPTLTVDRFENRGGSGTKVIGRWVRSLGLTDKRLSPSHSWRHRFKTLGRRHSLEDNVVNAITGHHRKTVADSYGEFPIDALYRELCKIVPVELSNATQPESPNCQTNE